MCFLSLWLLSQAQTEKAQESSQGEGMRTPCSGPLCLLPGLAKPYTLAFTV